MRTNGIFQGYVIKIEDFFRGRIKKIWNSLVEGGKLKLVNSLLIPVFFSVLQKQDGKEDDSKGICTADKWYCPKGKSIPCALLIIVMWIIFFPLIIVFAVSFPLWYVASACLTRLYMCGGSESGRRW